MNDIYVHLSQTDITAIQKSLMSTNWYKSLLTYASLIISSLCSITTTIVLLKNRSLTKQISESNIALAAQQATTAKQNKEIARSKYNLDLMRKRSELLREYKDIIKPLTESPGMKRLQRADFKEIMSDPEKIIEWISQDFSERVSVSSQILSFEDEFCAIMTEETTKNYQDIVKEIEKFSHALDGYNKTIEHKSPDFEMMKDYGDFIVKSLAPVMHSSRKMVISMRKNEFSDFHHLSSE